MDIKKTKRYLFFSAVWALCALIAITSATYAWFTSAPYANITPMQGTVQGGDGNLFISNRPDGPFDTSCDLILSGRTQTLHPITTADLTDFYIGTFQTPDGITVRYADANDEVDDSAFHGFVYLKSEGSSSDIYFNQTGIDFGNDKQVLGAMRLGLKITTSGGVKTHLFRLDDMADLTGIQYNLTVPQDQTVVSSISDDGSPNYVNDPSKLISRCFAQGDEYSFSRGEESLCSLQADEVATVEYWLYLEGCDSNCINSVQGRLLSLQLAFAGVLN